MGEQFDNVDHELRLTRIQLARALRVESEWLGALCRTWRRASNLINLREFNNV
jgi:hypothetical protein